MPYLELPCWNMSQVKAKSCELQFYLTKSDEVPDIENT